MDWSFGYDTIATIVIAVLSMAGLWGKAKDIIRELAQALTVTSDAIVDDDVTTEECLEIADEFYDVYLAARGKL